MSADRAPGTSGVSVVEARTPVAGSPGMIRLGLFAAGLLGLAVLLRTNSLLGPDEARHAGIVYDMWAARQYLMPRVDGLPTLDGAPLYYWIALVFVSVLGVHEWALRLPSLIAAMLAPWVMSRTLSGPCLRLPLVPLIMLALLQPALMSTGRLAAPDMMNLLLLTAAIGSFLRAIATLDNGLRAEGWIIAAWVASAFLALGAGPLALPAPAVIVSLWLAVRRRHAVLPALWSWPGLMAAGVLVLPWWGLVSASYPGIVGATFERQAAAMVGHGQDTAAASWLGLRGLLVVAAVIPAATWFHRLRRPAAQAALRSPIAGLIAMWLALLVPLYPLFTTTDAGPAALMSVPLLYFGALALVSRRAETPGTGKLRDWLAHGALGTAAVIASVYLFSSRSSDVLPLTQAIGERYMPSIDKVILLDRYDYEFNFYMRSPKLVFVAADWPPEGGSPAPAWKADLAQSARFAPETATRLLLSHEGFRDKLCERRVVNLWVVATGRAARHHPVLSDLTPIEGTGTLRAWYLPAESTPAQCLQSPRR